jgi:hypothetical protein
MVLRCVAQLLVGCIASRGGVRSVFGSVLLIRIDQHTDRVRADP